MIWLIDWISVSLFIVLSRIAYNRTIHLFGNSQLFVLNFQLKICNPQIKVLKKAVCMFSKIFWQILNQLDVFLRWMMVSLQRVDLDWSYARTSSCGEEEGGVGGGVLILTVARLKVHAFPMTLGLEEETVCSVKWITF